MVNQGIYLFSGELVPACMLSPAFGLTAADTLFQVGGEPVVGDFEGALRLGRRRAALGPEFPPWLLGALVVGRDGRDRLPSTFTIIGDETNKILIFISGVVCVFLVICTPSDAVMCGSSESADRQAYRLSGLADCQYHPSFLLPNRSPGQILSKTCLVRSV